MMFDDFCTQQTPEEKRNTDLFTVAARGKVESVEFLLQSPDIDAGDNYESFVVVSIYNKFLNRFSCKRI